MNMVYKLSIKHSALMTLVIVKERIQCCPVIHLIVFCSCTGSLWSLDCVNKTEKSRLMEQDSYLRLASYRYCFLELFFSTSLKITVWWKIKSFTGYLRSQNFVLTYLFGSTVWRMNLKSSRSNQRRRQCKVTPSPNTNPRILWLTVSKVQRRKSGSVWFMTFL